MANTPLLPREFIKLMEKMVEMLDDENDPEGEDRAILNAEIKEQHKAWSEYEDRETYRQESAWDPANIYDLTHLRDPYDDWEGDDPYESMYR